MYTIGSKELREARAFILAGSMARAHARLEEERRGHALIASKAAHDDAVFREAIARARAAHDAARVEASEARERGEDPRASHQKDSNQNPEQEKDSNQQTQQQQQHSGVKRGITGEEAEEFLRGVVAPSLRHKPTPPTARIYASLAAPIKHEASDHVQGTAGDGGDACEEEARRWKTGAAALSSEQGDDRPLSGIAVSPGPGTYVAVASWAGAVRVFDRASGACSHVASGASSHAMRATAVAWHPQAHTQAKQILASSSADATVRLWSLDPAASSASPHASSLHSSATAAALSPAGVLRGHEGPVSTVSFHPLGAHVGSASHDGTWRLWDVATAQSLVEQDGHSGHVTALVFQGDGALAVSTSTDAHALVWDLRRGRSVLTLHGHVDDVLHAAFHPDQVRVATASADNTVKLWDLRMKRCLHTIAAHAGLVRAVGFTPGCGGVLATASFDGSVRLWDARDYAPIAWLKGHDDKVTGLDWAPDANTIVTCSYDKKWKTWGVR